MLYPGSWRLLQYFCDNTAIGISGLWVCASGVPETEKRSLNGALEGRATWASTP